MILHRSGTWRLALVGVLSCVGVTACCSTIPRLHRTDPLVKPRSSPIKLDADHLSPEHVELLESIRHDIQPLIDEKKPDGTANILTWDAFYEPLNAAQRAMLDAFRGLKAESLGATSHFFGSPAQEPDLVPVGTQTIAKDGQTKPLDPQFLPRPAHEAYLAMMDAMQRDLGTRLLVESGYRSHAYQLYLFLFYLPKHGYSIRETNRFVALPGYSEHGNPDRQAIDFINGAGINGEDHPEAFEALPEYAWLQQHAARFGFSLSYPRDNPHHTAFEPWHWHYEHP